MSDHFSKEEYLRRGDSALTQHQYDRAIANFMRAMLTPETLDVTMDADEEFSRGFDYRRAFGGDLNARN